MACIFVGEWFESVDHDTNTSLYVIPFKRLCSNVKNDEYI